MKKLYFILFLTITNLFAYEITFMTHQIEGKTFIDENNELRGIPHSGRRSFNIELVREMMIKMNHPIKFKIYPFPRALHMIIENNEPLALFNIGRRDSREKRMKWVGPLQTDNIYFYENSKYKTKIKDIDDAKLLNNICVIRGSFHEKTLKKMGFKNIIINKNYKLCFKMLELGRVDLTVISINSINAVLEEANISKEKIINTNVLLSKTIGYIAFSNQVPDYIVNKWNHILKEMKKSGEYDKLKEKYLY